MDTPTCEHEQHPWRLKFMVWLFGIYIRLGLWLLGPEQTGLVIIKTMALGFYASGVNREAAKQLMDDQLEEAWATQGFQKF